MSRPHPLSPEILKACDIRGIVGTDFHPKDAYIIGKAFGTSLKRRGFNSCVAGFDGRLSSPDLAERAFRGLAEAGIEVVEMGLAPTPAVYFATTYLEADAGLIVTASHNPAEYNGFKFFTKEGPYHGADLRELGWLCESGDLAEGNGSRRTIDLRAAYVSYLHRFLDLPFQRDPFVVWDPGNGAVGAVIDAFLDKIPGTHRVICAEVDGHFPNHHPDPNLDRNLKMLQGAVVDCGADFGIAFDGDGDRIGVVDGEGSVLHGDQLLTLFARDLLARHPGARVMSEVKASRLFYDEVAACGGTPVMWKVGHTNQKERMRREGIPLAGETSGHIFFAENGGYDDALFAAVKLLNILTRCKRSLIELRKGFPQFFDSGEIRIRLSAVERERLLTETRARLAEIGRVYVDIDGIRADCEDGFWLMRGSNTEPHMTVRCEARSAAGLKSCMNEITNHLRCSGFPATVLSTV